VPNFPAAFDTITEARKARDVVIGLKQGGEQVKPSPKLKFGDASERWLAEQVSQAAAGHAGDLPQCRRERTSGRAGAAGGWTRSTSTTPRRSCASCAPRA
jgi:hypothetical protein